MKLRIEPTNRFTTLNGQRARVWRATEVSDEDGDAWPLDPPFAVLVSAVAPPADHPICELLEETLQEIGPPHEMATVQALDVCEVIDRRLVT